MELKTDLDSSQLVMEFKQDLKIKNRSPKTIDTYCRNVTQFLIWLRKTIDKPANAVTREDIIAYNLFTKQRNLAPNSVHRYMHSVKAFFTWLEEKNYVLLNPCDNMIIPRVPPSLPVVLTEKEIEKLLAQPNTSLPIGIRDRALLELLYATGIRLNELYNLNLFDIDTAAGFLRVTKGKGMKDRFVPLTKQACYWLKEYLTNVRSKLTKNKAQENSLFVGYCGNRLNKLIILRLVAGYAKTAGINKPVRVHTLRHTLATHLLENDADIFQIQKLLGHSHVSTTQRYTKVSPKRVKQEHSEHHPRENTTDGKE
jgi:integrase/recombinase XerD